MIGSELYCIGIYERADLIERPSHVQPILARRIGSKYQRCRYSIRQDGSINVEYFFGCFVNSNDQFPDHIYTKLDPVLFKTESQVIVYDNMEVGVQVGRMKMVIRLLFELRFSNIVRTAITIRNIF